MAKLKIDFTDTVQLLSGLGLIYDDTLEFLVAVKSVKKGTKEYQEMREYLEEITPETTLLGGIGDKAEIEVARIALRFKLDNSAKLIKKLMKIGKPYGMRMEEDESQTVEICNEWIESGIDEEDLIKYLIQRIGKSKKIAEKMVFELMANNILTKG